MPLHPQSRMFIQQIASMGLPPWSEMPVEESRSRFESMLPVFGEPADVASVKDIEHGDGFGLRVYHPSPGQRCPVAFYYHGGGWVLGDRHTHDSLCRHLAAESGCVVVSVDYRRAPEHKFPVPLDDACEAIRYVVEHASDLEVDSSRIAVAGDSAGGNLAAAVALRFRDAKETSTPLRGQLLIYPVLDARCDSGSYQDFAEGHGLTRATMQWFWQQYLGSASDSADPHCAPHQADSLAELPTTLVMTAEFDVLRDEGEAYAARLRQEGVAATLRRFDGMLHGFVHFASAFDDAEDGRDEAAEFLRNILA